MENFSNDPTKCNVASIRLLMDYGSKELLNHTDSFQQTALHHACVRGNYFGVVELLKCGIHVNALDSQWSTALSCACERGHAKIVSLLVETCDIFSCNMYGSTQGII